MQIEIVVEALSDETSPIVSVFSGRIADTGRTPRPMIRIFSAASPREVLNLFQADADTVGCNIVTVTDDLLKKLAGIGRDLDAFSLETVKMFFDDATSAGYHIVVE